MSEKLKSLLPVLQYLNRILKADREAVSSIFQARVPCNAVLRDDPTCQTRGENGGTSSVSAFGILNGIFGVDSKSWGFLGYETYDGGTGVISLFFLRETDPETGVTKTYFGTSEVDP